MSAVPIARYLLELDVGDDAGVVALLNGKGPASKTTAIVEAHAKAFESGKAAAKAEMSGMLDEREAIHRADLASAREAWARSEGARLADQIAKGVDELDARLADTLARILKPFLAAELRHKAVADLVECLAALRTRDKQAAITVMGAADLLEAVRTGLQGRLDNIAFHPGQASDVRVTVEQTVLETRFGAWMARIEEAVK